MQSTRTQLLPLFLLVVVMMTLPSLAFGQTYFYGELGQWDGIATDVAHSRGGELRSLKSVLTSDAVYIHVTQNDPSRQGTIYLTTGQDPFGYLGRGLWSGDPKIDYKVEDSILYQYDGTGFDEAWRKVDGVETTLVDDGFIVKVDLAQMKLTPSQSVQIAYYLTGLDYLPNHGRPLLKPSSIETNAQPPELELRAVRDHEKLFILVKGSELNPKNTYYFNLGSNTGFDKLPWAKASAEYKVENGTLYAFSGTPDKPVWTKSEVVHTYITADAVVMSVHLNLLGADATTPIAVGYINNKEHFLPNAQEPMFNVSASVEQPLQADTFYPTEYYGVLNNPYKGWAPSALYGPYNQPHRLVHAYISWRELEPERGVFAWDELEAKNFFDHWSSKGVQIVTRIMLDYPTDNPNLIEIPDWLYEMIDGDGTWYQTSEIGSGFSPNYSNPILIAEHERMIKAFGERYNNDPRIAFIQLGSIGHWGEWHTWPNGSGEFPEEYVANQYMQHYVEALDQKMLGIRRPLEYAASHGFGFFNDRIGHAETTEQWMFWMNNGMDYDDWYNRKTYPELAVPDFWKTAYSAGEFGSGNALMWLRDNTVSDTLRQVRISHTSWIGPCSPAGYGNIPELANLNTVLNTIGYHFVVETVTHEPTIIAGGNLEINMMWNNKGVAPFYFPWSLEIGLINSNGELVHRETTTEDITKWLPGRHVVDFELTIPQDLPAGSYQLVTAIVNPDTGKPGIDLGITGRRNDGRYTLSTLEIL